MIGPGSEVYGNNLAELSTESGLEKHWTRRKMTNTQSGVGYF